jgi:hypothetical protein
MKRIATLAAVIAVAAPGTALAGSSSTCQSYNPQLCAVANADGPSPNTSNNTSNSSSSGTLPFTGLDVALLAAGGGGLLGIGLVVRRVSSHTPQK